MNATGNLVGEVLKEVRVRGDKTQLQLGFEFGLGREAISKYENGRAKVPADVSRNIVDKYDDPKFAITIQREYTGTGPIWLNGPNADLHRCSVKEKTIEELQEALDAIKKISLSKPKEAINPYEKQKMADTLEEAIEAQTALANYIAVMTQHMDISYTGVWSNHYQYLQQEGYIK